MQDDDTPRNLAERTGRHLCVGCMAEIPADEYQRNDFLCDECAANDPAFPEEDEG